MKAAVLPVPQYARSFCAPWHIRPVSNCMAALTFPRSLLLYRSLWPESVAPVTEWELLCLSPAAGTKSISVGPLITPTAEKASKSATLVSRQRGRGAWPRAQPSLQPKITMKLLRRGIGHLCWQKLPKPGKAQKVGLVLHW